MMKLKYDIDQIVLLQAKVKEVHVGVDGKVIYRVEAKTESESRFSDCINIFAKESQIVCGWVGDLK